MSIRMLLEELSRNAIHLEVTNQGQLNIKGNKSALTPGVVAKLKANKAALIAYLTGSIDACTSIEVAKQCHEFPASFSQTRFWLMDIINEGGSQFHVTQSFPLSQSLNLSHASQALKLLVQRHPILRTHFEQRDRSVLQIVQPDAQIPLDSFLNIDNKLEYKVRNILAEHAARAFDLTKTPLMRLCYVESEESTAILQLTLHHIIADQSTIKLLVADFLHFYESALLNITPKLPAVIGHFGVYAKKQQQCLQQTSTAQRALKWAENFAAYPVLHSLPLQRSRPEFQTFAGALHGFTFEGVSRENISNICRQHQLTTFMFLNGVFASLIAKLSGEAKMVFGFPVDLRQSEQMDGVAGPFQNIGLLAFDFDMGITTDDFLSYVREVNIAARQHQDIPFEFVVEKLNPIRKSAYTPIFQIMVNVAAATTDYKFSLRFVQLEDVEILTKYDLTLNISEARGEIFCTLEYNKALFHQAYIQQMASAFRCLVEQFSLGTKQTLASLSLAPEAELKSSISALGGAQDIEHSIPSIMDAFSQQCLKTPDRIALTSQFDAITYAELHSLSDNVALNLKASGIGKGDRVGVFQSPAINLVVSILGVMKSGACYVPLSDALPIARILDINSDAALSCIIVDISALDLSKHLDAELLQVTELLKPQSHQTRSTVLPVCLPDDPAYAIYTSGSTGKPKGVEVQHGAVVNFLSAMLRRLNVPEPTNWVLLTPVSFDIALLEWLGCLLTGGTCRIISQTESSDAFKLASVLDDIKPDLIQATPSRYRQLLSANWSGLEQGVLLCGGEPLTPDLQLILFEKSRQLWNCYGPTEATVWSLVHKVTRLDAQQQKVHLLGTLNGYQHYVLDEQLEHVSPGQTGQLAITGFSLAKGYINNMSLTKSKFVQLELFGQLQKIYLTGDRVRWHFDGKLEFLGRTDDQIKINGHRVELTDIEVNMRAYMPGAEISVILKRNGDSDRLIAFVVLPKHDTRKRSEHLLELKRFARARLPAYMEPHQFVILDSMPLNPNGKVDKIVLSQKTISPFETESRQLPSTEQELAIAAIWRKVLGKDNIFVDQNFFDAGGDSLSLVSLASELKANGFEISMNQLMENQTIADLLAHDNWLSRSLEGGVLLRLNKASDWLPQIFLVHPLLGTLHTAKSLAHSLTDHCQVIGIQAPFLVNQRIRYNTLADLAKHYWQSVQVHKPVGPYVFGGISAGAAIAIYMCELAHEAGQESVLVSLDSWPLGFDGNFDVSEHEVVQRVAELVLEQERFDELTQQILGKTKVQQQQLLIGQLMRSTSSRYLKGLQPEIFIEFMTDYFLADKRISCLDWQGQILHFATKDNPFKEQLITAWSIYAGKRLKVFGVDGDHENFLDPEHNGTLVGYLLDWLKNEFSRGKNETRKIQYAME